MSMCSVRQTLQLNNFAADALSSWKTEANDEGGKFFLFVNGFVEETCKCFANVHMSWVDAFRGILTKCLTLAPNAVYRNSLRSTPIVAIAWQQHKPIRSTISNWKFAKFSFVRWQTNNGKCEFRSWGRRDSHIISFRLAHRGIGAADSSWASACRAFIKWPKKEAKKKGTTGACCRVLHNASCCVVIHMFRYSSHSVL